MEKEANMKKKEIRNTIKMKVLVIEPINVHRLR